MIRTPQYLSCYAMLTLDFHSRWAHKLMMDFGLAGLFDRFEKTLGEGWTKFILVLIAFAIVTTCFGLIWTFVQPIVLWLSGDEATTAQARNIATGVGVTLSLAFGAAGLVNALEARKLTNEARAALDVTNRMRDETISKLDKALKNLEKSEALLAETKKIKSEVEKPQSLQGIEKDTLR